jgi:radical SAM superfamily enzyme YgiQ (UPF0313 family)
MKARLIFPPFANPTFVPTMLAEVQGYTKARGLNIESIVDLNNQLFHYLTPTPSSNVYEMIRAWMAVQKDFSEQAKRYALESKPEWEESMRPLLNDLLPLPDIVGLSLTFHQRGDISQLWMTLALATWIKKVSPSTLVAIGGTLGNHIDPKEVMALCSSIDCFLLKESEESWVQLLLGTPLSEIPNTQATPLVDNIQRELIYTPDMTGLDLNQYLTPSPVVSLQVKRGCPWGQCAFCSSHASYFGYHTEQRWEKLDLRLRWLKDNRIDHVYWSDQMLLPLEAKKVSEMIADLHPDLKWAYMAMPHRGYSPELLEQLARSGCKWITWGIESASPKVLKQMNKPVNPEVTRSNIVASHSAGITNTLLMMQGFPGELTEDLQMSLDLLDELSPYYYDHAFGGYHVTTGSPVEKDPARYGMTLFDPIPLDEDDTVKIGSHLRPYAPFNKPELNIPYDKIEKPIPVMEWMFFN